MYISIFEIDLMKKSCCANQQQIKNQQSSEINQ